MSKIWYCPNCGYEVTSRGRCHLCKQKLVASDLPELTADDEADEVGYRLDSWTDRDRGRLIERLNETEILHRFEEDELVVDAGDEAQVDDLVATLVTTQDDAVEAGEDGGSAGGAAYDGPGRDGPVERPDPQLETAVRQLAHAARRLKADPTDMHADSDVAEASTPVFMAEGYAGADPEEWAAIGRVTRRLLGALGADEALENQIRSEAAVLAKLLDPLAPERVAVAEPGAGSSPESESMVDSAVEALAPVVEAPTVAPSPWTYQPVPPVAGPLSFEPVGPAPAQPADAGAEGDQADAEGPDDAVEPDTEEPDSGDDATGEDRSEPEQTVYEMPEWMPEQRAQLGVLLDEAGIEYEWDADELVVPAAREDEVEALFGQVGTSVADPEGDDDGGESRYHALEELFAATGRLAADPTDESRADAVVMWLHEAEGPPPLGMDDVYWLRIMNRAKSLTEAIEGEVDVDTLGEEASALHGLLRTVV